MVHRFLLAGNWKMNARHCSVTTFHNYCQKSVWSFTASGWLHSCWFFPHLKFIYSEKATKFCKISTVDLSYGVTVKSTVEILQYFLAFSEYMIELWEDIQNLINVGFLIRLMVLEKKSKIQKLKKVSDKFWIFFRGNTLWELNSFGRQKF